MPDLPESAPLRTPSRTVVTARPDAKTLPGVLARRTWTTAQPTTRSMRRNPGRLSDITIHHDGLGTPLATSSERASKARLDLIRRAHVGKGWSDIGYHFATRDEGVQLSGAAGFNWSVGIADGGDGDADEYRMSVHGDMDFGGGLTGGLTFTSGTDGLGIEGDTLIIDLGYTMDAISVHAEMAQVGDDGGAFTGNGDGSIFGAAISQFEGDSSPYAVAVTYDLGGESSIGIRIQDSDDEAGRTQTDIGYNYGNWGIQYSTFDNDTEDEGDDVEDLLLVSLQVGF